MEEIDSLAKILWDYHHLNMTIKAADVMLVFTSLDLSVPEYAAQLFGKGYSRSSIMIISGNNAVSGEINNENNIQRTDWGMPEAEKFKDIVIRNGVDQKSIITETIATNSGQNVIHCDELIQKLNITANSILLVHKPTMERRAYATFKKYWSNPDAELLVTSPPFSYEEYMAKIADKNTMINIMVGDLQRIKLYPVKGYQIPQPIPDNVWSAYLELVKLGFTKHSLNI